MAYYRAQFFLPAEAQDLRSHLAGQLEALGLAVEQEAKGAGLVACEPPSRPIRSREHVIVQCDWSDHAISGVVQVECRSDESMARRQTHCREVFEAVCLRLLPDRLDSQDRAA